MPQLTPAQNLSLRYLLSETKHRNHRSEKDGVDDQMAISEIHASVNAIMLFLLAKEGIDTEFLENKVHFEEETNRWVY